jgi:hypothetical protein
MGGSMSWTQTLDDVLETVPTPKEKAKALEIDSSDEASRLLSLVAEALRDSKTEGVCFNLRGHRSRWSKEAINQVILALGSKGWDVKRQKGSEARDPEGWDDLVVEKA